MLRHARRNVWVVAVLGFGACAERPAATASVAKEGQLSASLASEPGQEVAAGIAQALASPAIRQSVLQAFRASPWVAHKLVLQQFITTTAGRELVAAAASARGVSAADFANQINALPVLDFYVPAREDRLTWRGENTVGVALATSLQAPPAWAHTSDGKAITFASARTPGRVLVFLHPAEIRGRRIQRQAALSGSTIQDSDDSDVGVQFIHKLGSGDSVVYDLARSAVGKWLVVDADGHPGKELATAVRERIAAARLAGRIAKEPPVTQTNECGPDPIIPCDPGGGTGGGNPVGPGFLQPTYVTRIQTRDVCDMGGCGSQFPSEFEFRAKAYNANNLVVMEGTARITGVYSPSVVGAAWSGALSGDVPMIFTTIASGVTIRVDVVETDPWPFPDDHQAPSPVLALPSDKNRRFQLGESRTGAQCIDAPTNPCKSLAVDFTW